MAVDILDKLLVMGQAKFGKSFIMWVFLGIVALVGGLVWIIIIQAAKIDRCNYEQILSEQRLSDERAKMFQDQIDFYKNTLNRIEAVEKKLK